MNKTVYLKDYQAPSHLISHTALHFSLAADETEVTATYTLQRNGPNQQSLALDGEALILKHISIDGIELDTDAYDLGEHILTIHETPAEFSLEITCTTAPATNTALMGLYQSGDMLCTQCEAQGFRRIMWSLDRPDVLSQYTVTLEANKADYPILLSNGNCVDQGENGDQHWSVWDDPFPKPAYLFTLVAGKLAVRNDQFITMNGRHVDLNIYTRPGDEDKSRHAMDSLIKAMRWDETAYNREYDLDIFNIVAVNDFNMGAMENKSLNIFNTRFVLASPETATDQDYHNIESIIGHEYFHNWSGNRVTCRDWFQLSLKEGFTVFRDQQFSQDMGSAGVQRIADVSQLRNVQFREDSGPMAHPVRPDSYQAIDNFYTATVYEKGAEVVGMLETLVGQSTFRRATDTYFERFDGQAVTTDDFVAVIAETSDRDLGPFKRWYSQSGTPELRVDSDWDADSNKLSIRLQQSTPPTPGQTTKQAFCIPVRLSLFDYRGKKLQSDYLGNTDDEHLIELTQDEQHCELILNQPVSGKPIVSALRGFSAPVRLQLDQSDQALATLMAHDDDAFNRWEAAQKWGLKQILSGVRAIQNNDAVALNPDFVAVMNSVLNNDDIEDALKAQLLTLPTEAYVSQHLDIIDPYAVHEARKAVLQHLASKLRPHYERVYALAQAKNTGVWNNTESGARALRDTCLATLMRLDQEDVWHTAEQLYDQSQCMGDTISALALLVHSQSPNKSARVDQFYQRWQHDPLQVNKWLQIQAGSSAENTLAVVRKLTKHPTYDQHNPNNVYALLAGFFMANPVRFHDASGEAYRFAAEQIIVMDAINPQIAARLVSCFNLWRNYDDARQQLMLTQLRRIAQTPTLSSNVSEIVNKALSTQ